MTQQHEPDAVAARESDAPARAPTVARLLELQATAGNQAVARMLARTPITDIEVPAARDRDLSLRHLRHAGPLYVRGRGENETGIDVSDIRQGGIGDCFFLSPLMAIARINPRRIRNMIRGPIGQTRIGANVYEVTFPGGGSHRIDDRFVSDAAGNTVYAHYGDMSALGPEIWVMIMEKAWAAERGSYQRTHFGNAADAMHALTDEDSTWHRVADKDEDDIIDGMAEAISDGCPIVCNTTQTISNAQRELARTLGYQSLVPAHSYNVSWSNRARKTLDIMNPHGHNHLMGLPIAAFRQIFEWYLIAEESVR